MDFSVKPIFGMIHLSSYGESIVTRALDEINTYI